MTRALSVVPVLAVLAVLAAAALGPAVFAQDAPPDGGTVSSEAPDAARENASSEAPDLAFLEYLGSWQEDDDEWLVVSELLEAEDAERATDDDGARADSPEDAATDARRERAKRKDDEEGV